METTYIYQIFYDEASRQLLDPGFIALYKPADLRPDWREYWPMRNFLLNEPLHEDHMYGFLSSRFKEKTNLSAAAAICFVESHRQEADVILFSPHILGSSKFLNVYEHGEHYHPGLTALTQQLIRRAGLDIRLDDIVCDSTNTVYSNYFIAKPRFWRAWLAVNEPIFAAAEDPNDPLGELLRTCTRYRGEAAIPLKVFVMERTASLVLATDASFKARVLDPFAAPRRVRKLPYAIVCDALKVAYRTQGFSQYKTLYRILQGLRHLLEVPLWLATRRRFLRARPGEQDVTRAWQNREGQAGR